MGAPMNREAPTSAKPGRGVVTENGRPAEFVELGEALADWPEDHVIVVPGNHDGRPSDWDAALRGPLARFAPGSTSGAVRDLGDVLLVAISTQRYNADPLSQLGELREYELHLLEHVTEAAQELGRAVVAVMHHGPQWEPLWMYMGLVNGARLRDLLHSCPWLWVCCGHDHRLLDVGRVRLAPSVAEHPDPLRVYDVRGTELVSMYQSKHAGYYIKAFGI